MPEPIDLAARAIYRFVCTERLRFCDTDMLGHVNNVAYAALFESGRTQYLFQHLPRPPAGVLFVLARLEIDFRTEMHWPGEVEIGTAVTRIGTSSLDLGQGLFKDGRCHATSRAVLVWIGTETRRAVPLPPEVRAAAEEMLPG